MIVGMHLISVYDGIEINLDFDLVLVVDFKQHDVPCN